jgi:hypothetical protein
VEFGEALLKELYVLPMNKPLHSYLLEVPWAVSRRAPTF